MSALPLAGAFLALTAWGWAQTAPISIRVEQVSGNDSNNFRHRQTKALKIHLTNTSSSDLSDLKVSHTIFGRNLKGGGIEVAGRGDRQVTVAALKTEVMETPEVKSTYTDEHGQRAGKQGGGGFVNNRGKKVNPVRFKNVEAAGIKLTGYAVHVIKEGKVVAEAYSEPSLKEKVPSR